MKDLITDIYRFELARREQIGTRVPACLTVLSLLVAGAGLLLKSMTALGQAERCLLVLSVAGAAVALGVAGWHLYGAMCGRDYNALALGKDFLAWQKAINDYCGPESPGEAEKLISDALMVRMSEATTVNSQVNDIRSAHVDMAIIDFVIAVICEAIGFVVVIINTL
jgi:hypothetical protein